MGGGVRGPAIEINKSEMNVQDELEHVVTPESKGAVRVDAGKVAPVSQRQGDSNIN